MRLGSRGFHRCASVSATGHKDKVTPWLLKGSPDKDDAILISRAIDEAIDVLPLALAGDFNEAMKRLHTPK